MEVSLEMKKMVLGLFLLCVALSASVACAAGSAMDKDVLKVGTESTFRPFEFRNDKNEIVGFDIDLINAIGAKLGKKIEIVDTAFDSLIPSLLTNKIDIIAAGMSATAERAKKVTFSETYYSTPDAIVVKTENTNIKATKDLEGKTGTVQTGTIQDSFLTSVKGVKEIKRFSKTDDALLEVLLGRADFAVVDSTVTEDNLKNNKNFVGKLKVAFLEQISKTGMALAMNKEDTKLHEAVTKAFAELKKEGFFEKLGKKWELASAK